MRVRAFGGVSKLTLRGYSVLGARCSSKAMCGGRSRCVARADGREGAQAAAGLCVGLLRRIARCWPRRAGARRSPSVPVRSSLSLDSVSLVSSVSRSPSTPLSTPLSLDSVSLVSWPHSWSRNPRPSAHIAAPPATTLCTRGVPRPRSASQGSGARGLDFIEMTNFDLAGTRRRGLERFRWSTVDEGLKRGME